MMDKLLNKYKQAIIRGDIQEIAGIGKSINNRKKWLTQVQLIRYGELITCAFVIHEKAMEIYSSSPEAHAQFLANIRQSFPVLIGKEDKRDIYDKMTPSQFRAVVRARLNYIV